MELTCALEVCVLTCIYSMYVCVSVCIHVRIMYIDIVHMHVCVRVCVCACTVSIDIFRAMVEMTCAFRSMVEGGRRTAVQ